ncbi:MAG: fumarylacetoacetate hydrolase family protein [Alphaproteobacteria bacterium]|nr:MAG: fumarylacetoacetate hydrolase family protein [Alphaproteobacteria bacterium]
MRLVTFQGASGTDRLGALVDGDWVFDLQAAAAANGQDSRPFASMLSLIESGAGGLEAARRLLDVKIVDALVAPGAYRLRAPLPVPPQMRDFLSFEEHLKNSLESAIKIRAAMSDDPQKAEAELRASGRFRISPVWYQQPVYYKCNRFAVCGPDETVVWPAYSQIMDYELELAAVIGRQGRDIKREDARDHIFGFTIFNDFSARDAQTKEMEGLLGPAKGKDFDNANALGPCIVTVDEIGDPYDLAMAARVNGVEWSRGHSGTIYWTFEDMIAHVSQGETLYPGEVIGSGTVGRGCGLELMRFLSDGDVVELEIEKIGVLRNRVVRAVGVGA